MSQTEFGKLKQDRRKSKIEGYKNTTDGWKVEQHSGGNMRRAIAVELNQQTCCSSQVHLRVYLHSNLYLYLYLILYLYDWRVTWGQHLNQQTFCFLPSASLATSPVAPVPFTCPISINQHIVRIFRCFLICMMLLSKGRHPRKNGTMWEKFPNSQVSNQGLSYKF